MVRNRGQLLLIGAVLVGMTIVGTVVMLNSMQHADAAGSQSEYRSLDDAERTEEMVERDMERLVVQVFDGNPSDPEKALAENISTYDNYSRNMTVSRGDSTVNTSLNGTASNGWKIENTTGGEKLKSPSGNSNDWYLIRDGDHLTEFNVDITRFSGQGPGSSFDIYVTESASSYWQLRIYEETGASNEVVVETRNQTAPTWTEKCRELGPQVDLALVEGRAEYPTTGASCSFTGIRSVVDAPYDIEFQNGQKAYGTYELYLDGVRGSELGGTDSPHIVVPAVDYRYRSTELEYNRTILIETGDSP